MTTYSLPPRQRTDGVDAEGGLISQRWARSRRIRFLSNASSGSNVNGEEGAVETDAQLESRVFLSQFFLDEFLYAHIVLCDKVDRVFLLIDVLGGRDRLDRLRSFEDKVSCGPGEGDGKLKDGLEVLCG